MQSLLATDTLKHIIIGFLFSVLIVIFNQYDIKKTRAEIDNNRIVNLQLSAYSNTETVQEELINNNNSLSTVTSSIVESKNIQQAYDLTQDVYQSILQEQKEKNIVLDTILKEEPEQIPKYFRYKVQSGDSINGIANKFNIDSKYIFWNNIHLTSKSDIINIGDMIRVPTVEGVLHDVRFGETLSEISYKYNAEAEDIIDFPSNNIYDANFIEENVTILIVGGTQAKAATDLSSINNNVLEKESSAAGFVWPADGPITSVMTWWHPTGIDIGALYDAPVVATNNGTVIFAGGDPCCSYGLYVDIRHPGGFVSRVAHLNKIWVTAGQQVQRGEIVGLNGSTGRSSGPHVHFEIRRNGLLQNPLNYIPRTNLTFCDFC
ncbi:MAG: M23 family metallopeptidase [Dehalococcoidia bacterium]|nr:M23 family metallopeptidase [Dehalococcoidia bacterium]